MLQESMENEITSAIRDLKPLVLRDAIEADENYGLSTAVIDAMKSAGIFRIFVPREHGGLELDLPQIVEVIRSLSRIDASVGWTAMIGAGSALFATMLPRAIFERIYRNHADTIIAGSTQVLGRVEKRDDGWHASGRWPFASGCRHADWMLGFCKLVESKDGEPGKPKVVVVILPASNWTIEPTWRAPGLKGSGSHHIVLDSTVVPNENFFDMSAQERWADGPLYGGVPQIIALLHGAVSLGIAEGALDDLLAIAASGRRQERADAPMRDTEAFQTDLGCLHAALRAARGLLLEQTESHWRHALAARLGTNALLVEGSQAAIWTIGTCVSVVDKCFALAGSAALYDDSPLQRRMRDIHVAAQHNLMQPRHYVKAGKLLVTGELEP
jgi:indole-3-acetate monooxygenase